MHPRQQESAELERLAARAGAGQWSADAAIDWRTRVRLPAWITREQARAGISQLYHGEVATAAYCEALLADAASGAARRCLELQLADERRHAEAYARYLERLGGVAPAAPVVTRAFAAARGGPAGLLGATVAFQVVVEGEVLRLHGALARLLPCPLLARINRLVARDEARHVAFGRAYLSPALAGLPEAARRGLHGWVRGLWREAVAEILAGDRPAGALDGFLGGWLRGGWDHHAAALGRIGLPPPASD